MTATCPQYFSGGSLKASRTRAQVLIEPCGGLILWPDLQQRVRCRSRRPLKHFLRHLLPDRCLYHPAHPTHHMAPRKIESKPTCSPQKKQRPPNAFPVPLVPIAV